MESNEILFVRGKGVSQLVWAALYCRMWMVEVKRKIDYYTMGVDG